MAVFACVGGANRTKLVLCIYKSSILFHCQKQSLLPSNSPWLFPLYYLTSPALSWASGIWRQFCPQHEGCSCWGRPSISFIVVIVIIIFLLLFLLFSLLLNLLKVDHVHVEEGLLAQWHERVVAEVKDLDFVRFQESWEARQPGALKCSFMSFSALDMSQFEIMSFATLKTFRFKRSLCFESCVEKRVR